MISLSDTRLDSCFNSTAPGTADDETWLQTYSGCPATSRRALPTVRLRPEAYSCDVSRMWYRTNETHNQHSLSYEVGTYVSGSNHRHHSNCDYMFARSPVLNWLEDRKLSIPSLRMMGIRRDLFRPEEAIECLYLFDLTRMWVGRIPTDAIGGMGQRTKIHTNEFESGKYVFVAYDLPANTVNYKSDLTSFRIAMELEIQDNLFVQFDYKKAELTTPSGVKLPVYNAVPIPNIRIDYNLFCHLITRTDVQE